MRVIYLWYYDNKYEVVTDSEQPMVEVSHGPDTVDRIPPGRFLVPRPRLSELLDRGLSSRLVLVSAPAGFSIAALRTISPTIGKIAASLLEGPQTPPAESIAAILIGGADKGRRPDLRRGIL